VNSASAEFEPVEIRMEGVFDVAAAQTVVRAIERASADRDVRVDLTHVREFHDFAVAVLAQALARRRERVAVRGLRQHQLRLLNYLGLGQTAEPLDMSDSMMA
jgi:anti-anti-sigma regulatory factor